jgi:4-diphosphocytidyl-2C-methyl-D-erythritol kinase
LKPTHGVATKRIFSKKNHKKAKKNSKKTKKNSKKAKKKFSEIIKGES